MIERACVVVIDELLQVPSVGTLSTCVKLDPASLHKNTAEVEGESIIKYRDELHFAVLQAASKRGRRKIVL
uniref:Uncharacterized protein n=1 Tax=Peronospora matthiolae TaxID=2874970 RepID=A0AAV1UFE1_9STRA